MSATLELAVVIPTLNERDNIQPLLGKLEAALAGIRWEAIFVDDDSTDGTPELIRGISLGDPRVRLLHRVGRRGLSSACYEGMLASAAPYLAVMDADMQHDETLLPRMLEKLKTEKLDLVVGSRHLIPDGMGGLTSARVRLSQMGERVSRLLGRTRGLTDPMSGFFLLDRCFLGEVVHRTSGIGFKILVDLVASSPRPVRFAELPYKFRGRLAGQSKLDLSIGVELLYLVADKLMGNVIPVRFLMFGLAGLPGLVVHLAVLGSLTQWYEQPFLEANVAATFVAMTLNFLVNNRLTYRDRRLKGWRILDGLFAFYVGCSIGALANFALAEFLYTYGSPWYLAGLCGMTVASVWNFAIASSLAWRLRRGGQPYR